MDDYLPQTVLKSDLLNRLAINLDTAEEIGPITEVLVNGRTHQVKGLGCGRGLLGRLHQQFLWSQVASIGRDGVVLRAGALPEKVDGPLHDCISLDALELWSDHGDRIGHLTDYRFDPTTGNILEYRFLALATSPLAVGLYSLDPVAIISTGRRRMMAETSQLHGATLIESDPGQSVSSAQGSIPVDQRPQGPWPDPRRGWESAVETSRQARQQVSEQWQEGQQRLRSTAQDRWGNWLGDVKKRTRRLRNQLRETVTDVTAGLPANPSLRDDTIPTIDVEAMELWAEEEEARQSERSQG